MPAAGMGRTGEELTGMGRSYFACRLVQFRCRQVTRRRCLADNWKFEIEALLLSCTLPPTPALHRCRLVSPFV